MTIAAEVDAAEITDVDGYLGLSPEQRYNVASRHFLPWLLLEPIEFLSHHSTYGWGCRVDGCEGASTKANTQHLCDGHRRQLFVVQDSTSMEEFLQGAEPVQAHRYGWALTRRADCKICGTNREAQKHGYCQRHANGMRLAKASGLIESTWQRTQSGLGPFDPCAIERCVHDGELFVQVATQSHRLCRSHFQQWNLGPTRAVGRSATQRWNDWFEAACDGPPVTAFNRRGLLAVAMLPASLQREIRYAIHRHAKTARRTQWRPVDLQKIVDILADIGVHSLTDPLVMELAGNYKRSSMERRILLDLPVCCTKPHSHRGTREGRGLV